MFGATRNPWDLGRTCGGSSGGAAAALASGMVALADGSDMGGSLRNPASFCGVVGLRPSPGRVPTWPARYPWGALSVDGPMARSVDDLALFLGAIAGPDPRCPLSIDEAGAALGELGPRPAGGRAPLDGVRVAWSPTLGGLPVDARGCRRCSTGCRRCSSRPAPGSRRSTRRSSGPTRRSRRCGRSSSSSASAALYERAKEQLKATVQWNIEAGRRLTGPDVGRAEYLRGELFVAMAAFFERFDLVIGPVSQVAPFPVEVEYPADRGRPDDGELHRVDALVLPGDDDRLPGAVAARRLHPVGAAGRGTAGRPVPG